MRFTNILEDILGHKSKIKILRYLVNSNLELTGRQLSRAIGIHHRTSHKALKELTSFGIVVMHHTGKAIIYKINDNNIIVKDILRPIFGIESNLLPQAVKTILSHIHVKVIAVILFGSIASASERGTSDIDLLFLVNSKREQKILKDGLDKIEYNFILKYGNMLSAIVLTLDEFYRKIRNGDKLIENIIQKGKSVYGKSMQEVLIECQRKK
jgi:predicted nucleotidyltransferase